MIISRTPFRVSLFGGGTDYPAWYQEHGGAVVGTTINKYCYISLRPLPPFFEHKHRIVYSRIETPSDVNEIQHPSVRAVLGEYSLQSGVEIHHAADLPARSGLGSSSSFTVGLLNAIRAMQGKISCPSQLAQESIRIEQDVIKEKVGSQDQVWAAYGGTNLVRFEQNGSFDVSRLILSSSRHKLLESHLLLFFTGFTRIAEVIAAKKIENMQKKAIQLKTMHQMALEASKILQSQSNDLSILGEMLDCSWQLKRELAEEVSNSKLDEIYQAGMTAGAWGGKLLGAGGGGFMLFFAPPERHASIRQALARLIHVNIKIGSPGSKIVVYEPGGLETI